MFSHQLENVRIPSCEFDALLGHRGPVHFAEG